MFLCRCFSLRVLVWAYVGLSYSGSCVVLSFLRDFLRVLCKTKKRSLAGKITLLFFGLIHYSPTPACPASTPSRCCCSTRATSSSGPGVQKWRQSAFPISALGF